MSISVYSDMVFPIYMAWSSRAEQVLRMCEALASIPISKGRRGRRGECDLGTGVRLWNDLCKLKRHLGISKTNLKQLLRSIDRN